MAAPQFTSNATLRLGGDIGLLRDNAARRESPRAARNDPMYDGRARIHHGVSSAEVSCTIHVIRDSLQHKRLVAVFESQEVISYDYFDGSMHHPGDGVIGTLKISSQVNEAISYDISMAGADGTSTS